MEGHHQDFFIPSNAFSSFLSLFSKSKVARGKRRCADPPNVVSSCGDKLIEGKAKISSAAAAAAATKVLE